MNPKPRRRSALADQTSRGGKKEGSGQGGESEKHQGVHEGDEQEQNQRPPAGQPGGPKPNQGKTRPED